jgi:hypothetical protein
MADPSRNFATGLFAPLLCDHGWLLRVVVRQLVEQADVEQRLMYLDAAVRAEVTVSICLICGGSPLIALPNPSA